MLPWVGGEGVVFMTRRPRVVARSVGSRVYLLHVGDAEVAPGKRLPRGRVYERETGTLHVEFWLDSIVARGYWVEFDGPESEREAVEGEVASHLRLA